MAELVVANAAFVSYPGGVIALRCTDWMGAARGTLSSENDARAIAGEVVRDTQQSSASIFSGDVAAFQDVDDTLEIDLSLLPLEVAASNGMTYLLYASVLVEGDWDPTDTDTTRGSDQHRFLHTCRIGWYGDDNSTTDADPNWAEDLPRVRPHYVIVQLGLTASLQGDETLHIRAFSSPGTTTEILLDQIFFVPIVLTGTKLGEWRLDDFQLRGGGDSQFGSIGFDPPDSGGFVDGADGGDVNGQFTWEPNPGEVAPILFPTPSGGGDYQKDPDNEYMLRVVADDFYVLANTDTTPDSEVAAHAYSVHGSMYRAEQDWLNDDFTRTVADGWGNSPEGFAYYYTTGKSAVNGSQGVLTPGASGASTIRFINAVGLSNPLGADITRLDWFIWQGTFEYSATPTYDGSGDFHAWTRLQVHDPTGSPATLLTLYFVPVSSPTNPELGPGEEWWLQVGEATFPASSGRDGAFHGPVDVSSWYSTGATVAFKIELKRYLLRVKVWDASGAEPGAWDYEDFPPMGTSAPGTAYPFSDEVETAIVHGPFNIILTTSTNNDNSGHSTLWDDFVIGENPYGDPDDMTAVMEQPHGSNVGTQLVPYGAQQMVYWGTRDWTILDGGTPVLDFSSRVWSASGAAELQRAEAVFYWFRSLHLYLVVMNWRSSDRRTGSNRVLLGDR